MAWKASPSQTPHASGVALVTRPCFLDSELRDGERAQPMSHGAAGAGVHSVGGPGAAVGAFDVLIVEIGHPAETRAPSSARSRIAVCVGAAGREHFWRETKPRYKKMGRYRSSPLCCRPALEMFATP